MRGTVAKRYRREAGLAKRRPKKLRVRRALSWKHPIDSVKELYARFTERKERPELIAEWHSYLAAKRMYRLLKKAHGDKGAAWVRSFIRQWRAATRNLEVL